MAQNLSWKCPRSVAYVGLLLLALYAALQVLWPPVGGGAGTAMALLGLIAVLAWGKGIRQSAALWLLLAVIAVQVFSWVLGYFHHPQWVADNPEVDRLAKLFIFIGVAWWLGGSSRWTLTIWSLSLIGFLLTTLVHGGGLQEWLSGFSGLRVDFGIRNVQHSSMLFGTCLLGLLAVSCRVFSYLGRGRFAIIFGWIMLTLVCVMGVLIGKTRGVWLGLFVAIIFLLIIRLIWLAKSHGVHSVLRLAVTIACVLVVIGLGAIYAFKGSLIKRIEYDAASVEMVVEGSFQDLPYNSIGTRIHTWVAAGEWIAERPLVGWGGEGRGLVIDHTPWLPDFVKANFGHLHNFFLEVWVAYGLLGVGVIAALAFWIGRGTWLAWRAGVLPNDMALFGAAFFVYWMIVNQFESYNSFWTGVYVHNIVVGGLVTHIWRWQLESGRRVFAWPRRREA